MSTVQTRSEFPTELRMGLAMSGGIALVLYQSGVAHEALRFMRAWDEEEKVQTKRINKDGTEQTIDMDNPDYSNAYARAFRQVPIKPVIDIVTGASAGGINCVLLGHCISTGKTFDKFHDLWIQGADVARMQYGASETPQSLLNRDPLINRARTIMLEPSDEADKERAKRARTVGLIARLSRTDYGGHCLTTTDAIGHSLSVQTQASVIGFNAADFDLANDLSQPKERLESINAQLRAGESTSAFPGAFAPVEDPDASGKWYIDGGLWNNQPLDLAVQAVHDKPAIERTHRCLFVIQPDPVTVDDKAAPGKEPSVAEVLASVPLMGLNGSLWPAIENVLNFNQRSRLYSELLEDAKVSTQLSEYGTEQWQISQNQLNEINEASECKLSAKTTLLNQVRIYALLLDNDPALIERWSALLDRLDDRSGVSSTTNFLYRAAHCASLHALKAIDIYDLRQRTVRRELEELDQKQHGEDVKQETADSQDIRSEKAVLYAQLEVLRHYLFCGKGQSDCQESPDQDVSAFRDIFQPHSRFCGPTRIMLDRAEKLMKDKKVWNVDPSNRPAVPAEEDKEDKEYAELMQMIFKQWIEEVQIRAEEAKSHLNTAHKRWQGNSKQWQQSATFRAWPQDAHIALAEIIDEREFPEPQGIDYARHILAAISDLTGKKPIDMIRISPNDTKNLNLIGKLEPDPNDPTSPSVSKIKLAGEQLGHFSGFLQERWRRNDYIWARLDAAEIFLRTLQILGAREGHPLPEDEYLNILTCVQTEILLDEAMLWNPRNERRKKQLEAVGGIFRDTQDVQKVRANKLLIGYGDENISDADEPQLSSNIEYLINTAIRLMKGSSDKTPAAFTVLQRALRAFSYIVRWITALTPRKNVRSVFPVLLAILTLGVALIGIGWAFGKGMDTTKIATGATTFITYLAIGLLFITLGCLLGFRWYIFVPLSIAVGAWFGYQLGEGHMLTLSRGHWMETGTLILWILTLCIMIWNVAGGTFARWRNRHSLARQTQKEERSQAVANSKQTNNRGQTSTT